MSGWLVRLLFLLSLTISAHSNSSWGWARLVRDDIEVGEIHGPPYLWGTHVLNCQNALVPYKGALTPSYFVWIGAFLKKFQTS